MTPWLWGALYGGALGIGVGYIWGRAISRLDRRTYEMTLLENDRLRALLGARGMLP